MINTPECRYLVFTPAGIRLKITRPKRLREEGDSLLLVDCFFLYSRYKRKQIALREATHMRTQYEKAFGLRTHIWRPITGVSHAVRFMSDRFYPHCSWRASWRETVEGERKNRSKSFCYHYGDKQGETTAHNAAILYRKKMEKLHYEHD